MKQRLLLTLTATLLAITSWANGTLIHGIYYLFDSDSKTATVTYSGTSSDYNPTSTAYRSSVTIPASVYYNNYTYPVKSIGEDAFHNCSNLTSITIPNSVTSIGEWAFDGCSKLTSITIPNSVTSIGEGAFYNCSNLTSITIPNSVTSIGIWTFNECSKLASISFGNSVKTLGNYAFSGCTSLTSINLPDSLTSIGEGTFNRCTGLTQITIPDSVTSIRNNAFKNCDNLIRVTLNNNLVSSDYGYSSNIITMFGVQVEEYILGNSITSIGKYAFCRGYNVRTINIPSSVTNIKEKAFYGCSGLTNITVNANNTVFDSRGNCNAIIETASNTLIVGCQTTTIPNTVTSIAAYAFADNNNIESITIPNSVTSIGEYAFFTCHDLSSIDFGNSVTTIGNYAFFDCTELESVNIPNSVKTIGEKAFYSCYKMTSVTIGSSVKTIGVNAFGACFALTNIVIPDSVTTIEAYAFEDCQNVTSVTIGKSVKNIGKKAFLQCTGLKDVYSYSEVPPSLGTDVFISINNSAINQQLKTEEGCILHVPSGCKAAYASAWGWPEDLIVEMEVAGIEDILTNKSTEVSAYYNLQGQRLAEPQQGIIVVRYSDGTSRKVLVK